MRPPDPTNPRWLSRPAVRQARDDQRQQEITEQFEGDYESFDITETSRPSQTYEPKRSTRSAAREEKPERHVTRLEDGRVLKGSRPEQRKNAQFWTDISSNTEKLVESVHVPETSTDEETNSSTGKRPSRRPVVRRGKKTGADGEVKKPRTRGPRPSQKGYKWPDA
ncbi:hypothetical protein KDI_27590 [Dictyobacter arantiisoli]|uniref:Uncharacterized protein n=1 Tax=Dictyobacter arantiisoli TaxID=2014874 RepID=A0A5A5TDB3_9CHLR|nr:hypothetical protein KDI_27590 [Dictyobacter arantiisoli]